MAVKPKKDKKEETTSVEKQDVIFTEEAPKAVENTTEEEKEATEEVVIEEEDITDKEPVMTMTAVEEMLQRQEERWKTRLDSLTQKLKFGKAKGELDEAADYVAELEDDWLDTPVVFFAYSFEFSIHGDKKMGKETKPPHGMVKFKPVIRAKRQGRKGEEIICVSSVKVQSRALAEYLKGHSQFGIAFFENMDAVLNMNTDWAQRLIEANSSIQRLSDQQVISRCRQEGVNIGTDIVAMRKALVQKIAEKSIKHQENMMYGKLKNAVIEGKDKREIVERTIT